MDDFVFNKKHAVVRKKKKNQTKITKEMRAQKRTRYFRYIKHQESPVWVEEYQWPQYESCEPIWGDIYDFDDCSSPCHDCHYCGKPYNPLPTGWYELTFEHVNSR